ncbi:MAG: NUDIX domain-containing protein [Acidimicrobiales bacterium]
MSGRRRILLSVAHALRRVWWRIAGPRTLGVRGLVLDDDGAVLLVRHTYGQSWWHLPGGGVKRREGLAEACLRELREEVGVIVDGGVGDLDLFGVYSNLAEGKSDHVAVFMVTRWTRVETAADEIAEAAFWPVDPPPADVSPGTGRRLAELRGASRVSFRW